MILAVTVACFVLAMGVARILPPRYVAHARVMLDVLKPDPVTGQAIASNFVRGYSNTQVQIIQDYRVAGDVVDKLGWLSNPDVIAQWQNDTGGQGDMRRWAAQKIIDATNANLVEGSSILQIDYSGPNPAVAKAVVNLLREAYIDNSLRMQTDSAGRTAVWYREQADKAQTALKAAELTKSRFEQEHGLVAGPQGQEAETSKMQALQNALMQARAGATGTEFAGERQALGGQSVEQLRIQSAAIDDQLQQASERLGTEHPTYKALLARRTLMKSQLARAEADAKRVGASTSAFAQRNIAELEAQFEAQKKKVLAMREVIDQWSGYARDVDLKREAYQKAAQRAGELKLESDVSETGLVVLGDAFTDPSPAFPKYPLIAAVSLAFGLLFGIALAVFLELMARRVRGAEDLAFATKSPVLAIVSERQRSARVEWLKSLLSRRRQPDAPSWQPAQ